VRLAFSAIAWPAEADADAARLLVSHGVQGVELTPARVCERPWEAPADRVAACRDAWEQRGLPPVALQALLFGRSDLALFGDARTRQRLSEHLNGIIELAAGLGATRLVFGAPRNRCRGGLDPAAAEAIAIDVFRGLGRRAADHGVWLLIEPNPPIYGCDFLVDSRQVIEFVGKVDEPGLGVHLDSGAMALASETPADTMLAAGPRWHHFHASEPGLRQLGTGGVNHALVARALGVAGYSGIVSVEMAPAAPDQSWRERLEQALRHASATYGASG
jgi:D-psicose/D-tagatose/L-ribulose 3-epimerase